VKTAVTFFVYGLFDSGDWDRVKYIGAASSLRRPLAHEREARTNSTRSTRKHRGIRKVWARGHHVGWKILGAYDSWKETLVAERRLIQERKAQVGARPDWNLTDGGDGLFGFSHSPVTRAKLSAAGMGHPGHSTVEGRAKISRALTGRKRSPETIAKISAAKKGCTHTTETRERIRAALMGRKASPETKAKQRAARTGRKASPETRAKISAAKIGNKGRSGKPHTLATRAKISVSAKGRDMSKAIAGAIAFHTGRKQTPEHIAARAAANRHPRGPYRSVRSCLAESDTTGAVR